MPASSPSSKPPVQRSARCSCTAARCRLEFARGSDWPSPFDLRLGDPLAVAAVAVRFPDVPFVIPHFGAGFFREALMAARAASNIRFDTSSSNNWVELHPGLTLRDVFARSLEVVGPGRLLFGTDSSFFPRGWQRGVYDTQIEILTELGVSADDRHAILHGNFERLFSGGT